MAKSKNPCMVCALCGEELTAPQIHDGLTYGWSCIKKVVPSARKAKKSHWVMADSFVSNIVGQVTMGAINQILVDKVYITATYQGAYHKPMKFNCMQPFENYIIIQNGVAFIDLLQYKNPHLFIVNP